MRWLWLTAATLLFTVSPGHAVPVAWDLTLTLTNAGTDPSRILFRTGDVWTATVTWDSEAPAVTPFSASFQTYAPAISSAVFTRGTNQITFDPAPAPYNSAVVRIQPQFVYDTITMGMSHTVATATSAGAPLFAAPLSALFLILEDKDAVAFDSLALPISPGPVSQFEVRGLALDIPEGIGVRQTNFVITDLAVRIVPEPETGALLAVGLAAICWRNRRRPLE